MKKIVSGLLIIMMVASVFTVAPKKAQAKDHDLFMNVYPKMNGIKITWDKNYKVTKYILYRAKTTYKNSNGVPPKKDFKKIKTFKYKFKYFDKKVKKGMYYAYYLVAKRGKKKYGDSYYNGSDHYVCKGIDVPEVAFEGTEKDFNGNNYSLKMNIYDSGGGARLCNYIMIYKKIGDKYKKVATKKGNDIHFTDTKTQKGVVNSYKFKTYYKKGKKKYYSVMSKAVNKFAGNFTAKYNVEAITKPVIVKDANECSVIVKITGADRFNGRLSFVNIKDGVCAAYYGSTQDDLENDYNISINKYSFDGVNYKPVDGKNSSIIGTQSIYLELKLIKTEYLKHGSEYDMYYGGNDKANYKESNVTMESSAIEYDGPVDDIVAKGLFNLLRGTGTVTCK